MSHRSGETEDNFIADLAVGLSAGVCVHGCVVMAVALVAVAAAGEVGRLLFPFSLTLTI